MKYFGLNDIRKAFIDFYVEKGHYHRKSASLVPEDDKSLLIINSGMAPLKKFFSGQEVPPAKRMITCQKCIRTGDIDNVGKTLRHGTFFEMLGNFSFGDYFKKESIEWGWEFLTEVMELPEDRLWVTIYKDDEEAFNIWRNIGLPEERIIRLGKENNFWEIGTGPCGPDSEIFFDRGIEFGCEEGCDPSCEKCERFVEIWNHVFTQFSKEEDGSYSRLNHPNIDTGMGLERISCIIQGVDSIFDIDTVKHILEGVEEISHKAYEDGDSEKTDIAMRIITDHMRSMVFMIGDGILPSNEGRGYVLRRIIRRAARYGRLLGIPGAFLSELVDRTVDVSEEAYPELREKRETIKRVIAAEEERFEKTLDQGTEIISSYIDEMKKEGKSVLSGEQTFRLYDTFGFPPELTEEILREENFSCDMVGFEKHMAEQKEMARKNRKKDQNAGWNNLADLDIEKTLFVGYDTYKTESRVLLALSDDGNGKDSISEGCEGMVYLDRTPFYAEGGGQVADKGFMYTNSMSLKVLDVSKEKGFFAHKVRVTKGKITKGDIVTAEIDLKRRKLTARNHTATHLLHRALKDVLGNHINQAGSRVDDQMLRFDFTHFEPISKTDLRRVEDLVNDKIMSYMPVNSRLMSLKEAKEEGALALFDEKYGDEVFLINCGDYSKELCGGTHAANTGELGAFHIINESGIAAGVRRIEAVTAYGILGSVRNREELMDRTAAILKCEPDQIPERAKALDDELKKMKKLIEISQSQKAAEESSDMIGEAKEISGIKLITKAFKDLKPENLRTIADKVREQTSSVIMVLASVNDGKVIFLVSVSDDLLDKGYHAGKMVKEIAKVCGGGGGGKADLAQAGAKDPSKLDEAFKVAESLI